ncbi:putative ras-related protein Rab-36, partial [Sesbania bispinosa]
MEASAGNLGDLMVLGKDLNGEQQGRYVDQTVPGNLGCSIPINKMPFGDAVQFNSPGSVFKFDYIGLNDVDVGQDAAQLNINAMKGETEIPSFQHMAQSGDNVAPNECVHAQVNGINDMLRKNEELMGALGPISGMNADALVRVEGGATQSPKANSLGRSEDGGLVSKDVDCCDIIGANLNKSTLHIYSDEANGSEHKAGEKQFTSFNEVTLDSFSDGDLEGQLCEVPIVM